ncbi:uncharacterized protein LOC129740335 [Uranotaenia lowii]|uniref:uncharacterized protein LOC129740335 n=1 Tax=Uranotaenia lowii TaxID=190385 RepID=UPI00247AEA34|nr:uncharacterized protein LOC129740335 [Uranotaenia lowii]
MASKNLPSNGKRSLPDDHTLFERQERALAEYKLHDLSHVLMVETPEDLAQLRSDFLGNTAQSASLMGYPTYANRATSSSDLADIHVKLWEHVLRIQNEVLRTPEAAVGILPAVNSKTPLTADTAVDQMPSTSAP